MDTHERIEELADLAAAGAWAPDGHATSCASCAAVIADARAFRAWASGAITPDAPPADLEDRLIARFRASATPAARRFRLLAPAKRLLKWTAGAAAAAGLVVLGSSFAPAETESLREVASLESDFIANDAQRPMFAVEDQSVQLGAVDGRRLGLVSPTAGGAGPLAGATFDLDDGIVRGRWGDTGGESASRANRALGAEQVKNAELLTKLEADAQVFARQKEVALAQVQEIEKAIGGGGRTWAETLAKLEPEMRRLGEAERELSGEELRAKRENAELLDRLRREDSARPVTESEAIPMTAAVRLVQDQQARKLIRTATLSLEIEAYEAAQEKVAAAAVEEMGYVASADTERLQNGKMRATVKLRVPPDRFEALLAKLRALGTVRHQSLGTADVTKSYVDMEARLGAKQALLERLKKVLAEAKGSVKELMEVEVQMGATLEQIEALKGELKYLDNQVALATVTLELAEKDLGQPFEYVQTLQSRIGLVTADVDAAYAAAQKAVADAGGQVVDSKMTRQNDGAATGTIKARVEAAKFPDVRRALRGLGHVETDTVDQQKSARGGEPTAAAPVRVEQATVEFSVSTPALVVSRQAQVVVETKEVEAAYLAARKAVEQAGGRVLDGGLSKRSDGGSASLTVQVDVDKFAGVVETFKSAGEVKHAVVNQSAGVIAVPVRERGQVILQLQSPPAIIGEEHGIARTVRETFGRSWAGLLWSVEKLFVGISLAGPWLALAGLGWLLWRRARRRKPAPAQ